MEPQQASLDGKTATKYSGHPCVLGREVLPGASPPQPMVEGVSSTVSPVLVPPWPAGVTSSPWALVLLWGECLGAHILLRFPLTVLALTHHFLSNVTTRPGLVLPQGPLVWHWIDTVLYTWSRWTWLPLRRTFQKLPGRVFRYKWVRHREPSSAPKEQHRDLRHVTGTWICQKKAATLSLSLAGGFLLHRLGLQARVEEN